MNVHTLISANIYVGVLTFSRPFGCIVYRQTHFTITITITLLLQLVLCRVAALKVSPYIIHSADYILFRSFEISKYIQSVQNTHV